MGEHSHHEISEVESHHLGLLRRALRSSASDSLVYSYKKSFNGFAAKLSEDEYKKIASMKGVVSVFPNNVKQLHTTRSWDFMGFSRNMRRSTIESDVIIGMVDTGIWPESESFNDDGFGPPPTKWKGSCVNAANFTCNNKIIGAKAYRADGKIPKGDFHSPRDIMGHGSHTASTAAGREVSGVSLLGLGEGTGRGGVPSARIAVYKVCWLDGCYDADILAAFDDAIADGVDVISISIGGTDVEQFFENSISIGGFHAMKRGILTSVSAGNQGPAPATLSNYAPWMLTVAASSIDRKFVAQVKLGNGNIVEGLGINTYDMFDRSFPLVYAGNVPNTTGGWNSSNSRICEVGSLDDRQVKGKIVLCDFSRGFGPLLAGATGAIMLQEGVDVAYSYPLPATALGNPGLQIFSYINGTRNPEATILKSKGFKDETAPRVVHFSSRGPNPVTSDILKPDLTAPGADILAAWSPAAAITDAANDRRFVPYNIISGTSMSCPHASAAAAYLKSFNPTWSPAAIKSALMTTANPMNPAANKGDAEFAYGAGHLNPVGALNPGLVYDADEQDYVEMLCNQGYDTKALRLVSGDSSTCTKTANGTVWNLNYPSIALKVSSRKSFEANFSRTVTNVGPANSVYKVTVSTQPRVSIRVTPSVLAFTESRGKKSFVVTVEGMIISEGMVSGFMQWLDGTHVVRSPVVVYSSE
ncbi:hypothetical protein ACLOJK_012588 [Asimina triloba]